MTRSEEKQLLLLLRKSISADLKSMPPILRSTTTKTIIPNAERHETVSGEGIGAEMELGDYVIAGFSASSQC